MSILIDTDEWKNNPWYKIYGDQHSDYTGFYVGISICTIIVLSLIVINFVFCCCTPYKLYWRDPNTGNRWTPASDLYPIPESADTSHPSTRVVRSSPRSLRTMFHVWWPATAVLAVLVMMTILIILMYGDRICRRVQTQTETFRAKRGPPPQRGGGGGPSGSTSRTGMMIEEPEEDEEEVGRRQERYREQQQQQPRQPQQQYQQPQHQQPHHYYDDPPEIEQYEEREVGGGGGGGGGIELQQQHYPKKTFSREAEV